MLIKNQINNLFKREDNLSLFKHPEYKKRFYFLDNKKIIFLAKKTSRAIIRSNCKNILVNETGATVFANICKELIDRKYPRNQINWIFIKFPREPKTNLFFIIRYYLKENELKEKLGREQIKKLKSLIHVHSNLTRELILKEVCNKIPLKSLELKKKSLKEIIYSIDNKQTKYQKIVSIILENTEISRFLSERFILFEDFITSGHTINLTINYLKFFSKKLDFKIICYYFNLKDYKKYKIISFSLYDLSSKSRCFDYGTYPFENRVDLLGYFYAMDKERYEKIKLSSLIKKDNCLDLRFIDKIKKVINKNGLLEQIKKEFKIKDLRDFISIKHLIRYYFYVFEKELKIDEKSTEFLWLVQDMYGPLWLPLPIEYHLEFMRVLENFKTFRKVPEFNELLIDYKRNRQSIINEIIRFYKKSSKNELNQINKIIKNEKSL
jgi:hypothetical protein